MASASVSKREPQAVERALMGERGGGMGLGAVGTISTGLLTLHSLHQGGKRVWGARAWLGTGRRLNYREVGPREAATHPQLCPDGQFSPVSGKQMTERKPSGGDEKCSLGRVQIWVEEGGKPLPRARGLPPPRMRQRPRFRGAGEGAASERAPRRKTVTTHGAGESSAHVDIQRTCKYM